jgi:hypothetical protein
LLLSSRAACFFADWQRIRRQFAAIALPLNALKIASEIKKACQEFFVAAFSDAYHCCAWLLARSAAMLALHRERANRWLA